VGESVGSNVGFSVGICVGTSVGAAVQLLHFPGQFFTKKSPKLSHLFTLNLQKSGSFCVLQ
jgi:hypothetical protein